MLCKRRSLKAMLLVTAIMVVSACSSANEQPNNPAPSEPNNTSQQENNPANSEANVEPDYSDREPVTLQIMNWGGDTAHFDDLYALFTEKYPWITVKSFGSGGGDTEALSRIAASLATGDIPDIVWPQSLAVWNEGNNLEDLKPWFENDPVVGSLDILDGFFESWEQNGKIYAFPWTNDAWPLVVNKDLLHKHGMEMPSNDWTWDDFRDMAIQATDPAAGEYGISNWGVMKANIPQLLAISNGHAGKLGYMNKSNTQSTYHTPGVQADVKWIVDLYTGNKTMMDVATLNETGYGDGGDFLAGKALFTMAQPLNKLDEMVDFEWDILPTPLGTDTRAFVRNTSPIAMLSASKHKEEAWLFLRFQFEYEAEKWRAEQGGGLLTQNKEAVAIASQAFEGRNYEAITIGATSCCSSDMPITYDIHSIGSDHVTIVAIQDGYDPSEHIPVIEDYNRRAAEYWNAQGIAIE